MSDLHFRCLETIDGQSVSLDGNFVAVTGTRYKHDAPGVTTSIKGLYLFSLDNPHHPKPVAKVEDAALSGAGQTITLTGAKAYWAVGQPGVRIYGLPNLNLIGTANTPGFANHCAVAGTKLYIADGNNLAAWDVSNPASPTQLGTVPVAGAKYVKVVGNFAYIACSSSYVVVDVSNPAAMVVVATRSAPAQSLDVAGNIAAVVGGGLTLWNVATPSNPTQLSSFPAPSTDSGANMVGVQIVGSKAYVAAGQSVYVFNIANPNAPVLIDSVRSTGLTMLSTKIAVGANENIYVSNSVVGVAVIGTGPDNEGGTGCPPETVAAAQKWSQISPLRGPNTQIAADLEDDVNAAQTLLDAIKTKVQADKANAAQMAAI